eukprot:188322-Chlamydomonas_euryale.AAC.2
MQSVPVHPSCASTLLKSLQGVADQSSSCAPHAPPPPGAPPVGLPVYNFCVAVDDCLMQINHVIRAEEHLPNTLRQ